MAMMDTQKSEVGTTQPVERKRLLVVLDWVALDLSLDNFWQLDNTAMSIARLRFGQEQTKLHCRIYAGANHEQPLQQLAADLHMEGLVEQWRFPIYAGRAARRSWIKKLRTDVLEWSEDNEAVPSQQSSLMLVTNRDLGNNFIKELDERGVNILLLNVGCPKEDERRRQIETFGEDRIMQIGRTQLGEMDAG